MRAVYVLSVLLLASAIAPHAADAQVQPSGRALAAAGGVVQYDLSGTGTTAFGAVRLELPLTSVVLLEPGLSFSRYDAQFGSSVSLLFPEVQLQVQGRGVVSPYLGVGVGPAFAFAEGQSATDLSLSGALGLRVRVDPQWRIGGELRIRAIDPFHGTTAEWGLGVSRRF
jgi:Outer membrane protein beta-barrel domain